MISPFLEHLETLGLAPGLRALVAVSGGTDSMALLHLLFETRDAHHLDLVVAHVDHGIHPASSAIASRVEQAAQAYGLRCITGHLTLGEDASETRARESRYAWLYEARMREGAEYIVTAHHADDQTETVFLRMLQGTGPAGLSAMQSLRGPIVRPLLPFKRRELRAYAREHRLPIWDDPANDDPRHLRSWLRGQVLPKIRERLPGVDDALLQVAEQATADRAAWDRVLDLLPGLDWRAESTGGSVAVASLAGYDSILGLAVLRACARRAGCQLSREHAQRALPFLARASSGSRLELGNGWVLEIVFDRLHLVQSPPVAHDAPGSLLIEGTSGNGLVGPWRFSWRLEPAPALQERNALTAWFIPQALAVRTWAAGDKVFPLGGRGRRLVVRCFQDEKTPRGLRADWPVVESAGEIVWVPGICRSNRLLPAAGTEALRVDAQIV